VEDSDRKNALLLLFLPTTTPDGSSKSIFLSSSLQTYRAPRGGMTCTDFFFSEGPLGFLACGAPNMERISMLHGQFAILAYVGLFATF
jgi:hypothetical protein